METVYNLYAYSLTLFSLLFIQTGPTYIIDNL